MIPINNYREVEQFNNRIIAYEAKESVDIKKVLKLNASNEKFGFIVKFLGAKYKVTDFLDKSELLMSAHVVFPSKLQECSWKMRKATFYEVNTIHKLFESGEAKVIDLSPLNLDWNALKRCALEPILKPAAMFSLCYKANGSTIKCLPQELVLHILKILAFV